MHPAILIQDTDRIIGNEPYNLSKQAQNESINSFISEEDLNSYDYEDDTNLQ